MENNDERIKNIFKWDEEDIQSSTDYVRIGLGESSAKEFEEKVRQIKAFAEITPGSPDDKLKAIKKHFPEEFK